MRIERKGSVVRPEPEIDFGSDWAVVGGFECYLDAVGGGIAEGKGMACFAFDAEAAGCDLVHVPAGGFGGEAGAVAGVDGAEGGCIWEEGGEGRGGEEGCW